MYINDIFERIAYIMKDSDKEDIRPNSAKRAKFLACGYRTIKAAYETLKKGDDNGKSKSARPMTP